jgi:hypothetical protein
MSLRFKELELLKERYAKEDYYTRDPELGFTFLIRGASLQNLSFCSKVVAEHPDLLGETDCIGNNALHSAVMGGSNLELIQFFLDKGERPIYRESGGNTLSSFFSVSRKIEKITPEHIQVVNRMLDLFPPKIFQDGETKKHILREILMGICREPAFIPCIQKVLGKVENPVLELERLRRFSGLVTHPGRKFKKGSYPTREEFQVALRKLREELKKTGDKIEEDDLPLSLFESPLEKPSSCLEL